MDSKFKIKLPDYDNCIVGITSSILNHYGIECNVKTLPLLDKKLEKGYKNIVFILFDGLGSYIAQKHLSYNDFLLLNKESDISTVFPPTTTAATVSLISGLLPIEHSWLGWNLYFKEIDKNVSIFPNTISGTKDTPAASFNVAERYIPFTDIITKINNSTENKVQATGVFSFNGYKTKSTDEMFGIIKELCSGSGKRYVHAYWYEPDSDMHKLGTNHAEVCGKIKLFNKQVEKLCKNLSNTLVIVTADHGLIDTEYKFITDYPEIVDCMVRPHSIESRAMNFFIKDNKCECFENIFNSLFGEQYKLYKRNEVLETNIFGNASPHKKVHDFLGDYLAIAIGNTSIEYSRPTYREIYKAQHAGLTENEMLVPLIMIDC